MRRITRYVCYDIARNKIVLAYAVILFAISFGLFSMEEQGSKALLSLLSIVLLAVPLISLIFSTIYYYNAYEFTEMLLCQPAGRSDIIKSQYAGVASMLVLAFILGAGIPVLLLSPNAAGFTLLAAGVALTLVFSALGLWVSVRTKDKARGIGLVLLLWFFFTVVYDAIILLILFTFADYPLEKITVALSVLNPVDLARITLMLQTDNSALLGYTGALYQHFFGSFSGLLVSVSLLLAWVFIPLRAAVSAFRRKDM